MATIFCGSILARVFVCYLLIGPKPLLPITKESNWRSSTALHNFSLGSPQYTLNTALACLKTSINNKTQIHHICVSYTGLSSHTNCTISLLHSAAKQKRMERNNIITNTPLVLESVSRISMTSGSLAIPYCFVKFISLNSSRGTKAAKTH